MYSPDDGFIAYVISALFGRKRRRWAMATVAVLVAVVLVILLTTSGNPENQAFGLWGLIILAFIGLAELVQSARRRSVGSAEDAGDQAEVGVTEPAGGEIPAIDHWAEYTKRQDEFLPSADL